MIKVITNMNWIDIFFPILKSFKDPFRNDLDDIVENNYHLAKELEGKPPMSAQEIKEYVKNRDDKNTMCCDMV